VLVTNGSSSVQSQARIRFNGDTGSNYSAVIMRGGTGGPASGSGTFSALELPWNEITATDRFVLVTQIMDYSATDKHKTVLNRSNATTAAQGFAVFAEAWRWANTSAVTSIVVATLYGSWNTGTTFNLYGIAS
jgi:hypothetical protein